MEPINIITGAQGAGKTLFAIAQSDALRKWGDAKKLFAIGINEPDTRKLPPLPFPIQDWYLPEHAETINGAVIIVDEFHEVFPQRGQGKPPEYVEQLAQARKRGVRFVFLTQSVEFDHFLKGSRCNRHFHLERKAGLRGCTVREWQNEFCAYPKDKRMQERATWFRWNHDLRYKDWYVSAESHHFRPRIPFRIIGAAIFVVAAVWFAQRAYNGVGGLFRGDASALTGKASDIPAGLPSASDKPTFFQANADPAKPLPMTKDQGEWSSRFLPVHPEAPWSAPAFQGRAVAADPQLYCIAMGDGLDGNGEWSAASCHCYTEQATRYAMAISDDRCRLLASQGVYNPYKPPLNGPQRAAGGEAGGEAHSAPRPTAPGGGAFHGAVISSQPSTAAKGLVGTPADQMARAPGYPTSSGFSSF
ncbi:hypothetical protein EA659_13455 [Pseudoxanthomonas winnipegensis]|nr:hypothetical protein EA659_13455 [Pseudoxanthomonas winnipegensis]